ncbi:hypothetical protein ACWWJF_15800 [Symbiopectobacterium sp. Eva_TO]
MSRYHVENIPDGINISQHTAERLYGHVDLIPYADAMTRLDAGEWDDDLNLAFEIARKWGQSDYDYTHHDALLLWRWVIAFAFNHEQRVANGTVTVEWRPGEFRECAVYQGEYGAMNLYLSAERFAMANNIEGALIEKYGPEQGMMNAIQFYTAMRGERGGLSDMGREVLCELHDSFIKTLNDSGMPEAPTAH